MRKKRNESHWEDKNTKHMTHCVHATKTETVRLAGARMWQVRTVTPAQTHPPLRKGLRPKEKSSNDCRDVGVNGHK